jgi:hypothetical protein
MKSTVHSRLARLEANAGSARQEPLVIIRKVIEADGSVAEMPAYADADCRLLARQSGESYADFEARIVEGAKSAARHGVAVLRPVEDIAEFENGRLGGRL